MPRRKIRTRAVQEKNTENFSQVSMSGNIDFEHKKRRLSGVDIDNGLS